MIRNKYNYKYNNQLKYFKNTSKINEGQKSESYCDVFSVRQFCCCNIHLSKSVSMYNTHTTLQDICSIYVYRLNIDIWNSLIPHLYQLCRFTVPQNQVNHIFCVLVEDGKDVHEDFPSLSHPLEDQSEKKGAHSQAQHVGFVYKVTHLSHISGILRQDRKLINDRGSRAISCSDYELSLQI